MDTALAILAFVLTAICIAVFCVNIYRVIKYSALYKHLNVINTTYKVRFFKVSKIHFSAQLNCGSLQKYRNNNNESSIINYLCGYINENRAKWDDTYSQIQHNKVVRNEYMNEYEAIRNKLTVTGDIGTKRALLIPESWYARLESQICKSKLLHPTTNVMIVCNISYVSPKGRNHYRAKWSIDMEIVYERIRKRTEYERSVAYQRALMTDSLRIDILTRDNFRCQICGATSKDGAKLEVDHIIPVSKGGKTIKSNLQTLCRQCNQGKKAKIL